MGNTVPALCLFGEQMSYHVWSIQNCVEHTRCSATAACGYSTHPQALENHPACTHSLLTLLSPWVCRVPGRRVCLVHPLCPSVPSVFLHGSCSVRNICGRESTWFSFSFLITYQHVFYKLVLLENSPWADAAWLLVRSLHWSLHWEALRSQYVSGNGPTGHHASVTGPRPKTRAPVCGGASGSYYGWGSEMNREEHQSDTGLSTKCCKSHYTLPDWEMLSTPN